MRPTALTSASGEAGRPSRGERCHVPAAAQRSARFFSCLTRPSLSTTPGRMSCAVGSTLASSSGIERASPRCRLHRGQ
eukprot:scaffold80947_cov29-Tisochrysis_lutea.AAC.4